MPPLHGRRTDVIYHQVRFAMKPEAPNAQVDNALELLRRLGRELDVVEFFCVGRDFGGEFTVGALYALKDIKAYETYMNAPLHLQIDRAGPPLVSNMISQDLTDDEDPDIGEKSPRSTGCDTRSMPTSRIWWASWARTRAAAFGKTAHRRRRERQRFRNPCSTLRYRSAATAVVGVAPTRIETGSVNWRRDFAMTTGPRRFHHARAAWVVQRSVSCVVPAGPRLEAPRCVLGNGHWSA
jgi:hypothetical protein